MDAACQAGLASALLDVLFHKVTDFVTSELKKIMGSDLALGRLQTTILKAQKILNQVDTFELQGNIKNILQERMDNLTELCYNTEDMMDDISRIITDQQDSQFFKKPVLKAILASPRNWTKPHNIDELQNKLDAILKELNVLVELTGPPETRLVQLQGYQKPNSEMTPPLLPLRNNDVEAIVQKLISSTSNGVSIVGTDGIGKTMVALTILNEAKVTTYFPYRLWVDLAGCFEAELIFQQLEQLHTNWLCDNAEAPCNQSILMIFDNLLEVKLDDWNVFWSRIRTKGINERKYKNIKLLITTFNSKVPKHTGTSSHYLKPLSDDKCREVIIATAKSHNEHLCDMHFRHADLLSKRCGGLPSVASILGVFLAQYDTDEVRNILNEDLWDSVLFKVQIFPALKSCYKQIHSQLKRCLAYFSLFPEDYAFTIDEVVQLWVGEGFFQDHRETLRLLQAGKDQFTNLLGMSIIRLSDPIAPKETEKYKLNPFGYKFAQLAASRTCLRLVQGVSASNINTRHLSYTNADLIVWSILKKFQGLRTLMSLCQSSISSISEIPPPAFKALTRLRVLSFSQTSVSNLPDSIKYLKHLRYLDISHTLIKTLPETLSKVHTLQFLKFAKDRGNLEHLPKDFKNLTNMVYVDWGISDIKHMGLPSNIGQLSSLQTLPLYLVDDKIGHYITELNSMNHLQGSLCISNLEKVQDCTMARDAMLCEKSSLKEITLEWMTSENEVIAIDVLRYLKPHQNLKHLKIINYYGSEFPDWMVNSLTDLEKMHLHNCPRINVLPKFGSLPNLKVLVLEELEGVVNVDHHFFEEGHFPKLESLVLKDMEQLQEWIIGDYQNVMPCLRILKFIDCPMMINMPSLENLSSLVDLQIESCGAIRSLPNLPSSLESLTITDSDLLSNRCRDGGEDWEKVDCITNVEIEYQKISTSGSNSLPASIDQQIEDSSLNQHIVLRGYQLIKDGPGAIARWFGMKN